MNVNPHRGGIAMKKPGAAVRLEPSAQPEARTPVNRWWTYQKERFPLVAYVPLIAAFSFAAVGYSALGRGPVTGLGWRQTLVAFLTSLMFFLQLRLADEFKDFEDDLRYRPYRPVQRGLVKLGELALVGVACAPLQLLLALWLSMGLLPLLAIVWSYLLLMTKEFFVPRWLKRHPLLYLLSHMVITPLIFLFASACDWTTSGYNRPSKGLLWMMAVGYCNGMVVEIGRKVRAPEDEETGVETYSSLWGRRNAVLVWLAAIVGTAAFAYVAAGAIQVTQLTVSLLLPALLASALAAAYFLAASRRGRGKWIETISGLWALLTYLSLGALPALQRWYGGQR
jgi:4-hydroxybenzoate polyprenyltransferase